MREYRLNDCLIKGGGITVLMPERSCVFCEHCLSVFWDYTHGVYMCICEKELYGLDGKCDSFEEE